MTKKLTRIEFEHNLVDEITEEYGEDVLVELSEWLYAENTDTKMKVKLSRKARRIIKHCSKAWIDAVLTLIYGYTSKEWIQNECEKPSYDM